MKKFRKVTPGGQQMVEKRKRTEVEKVTHDKRVVLLHMDNNHWQKGAIGGKVL